MRKEMGKPFQKWISTRAHEKRLSCVQDLYVSQVRDGPHILGGWPRLRFPVQDEYAPGSQSLIDAGFTRDNASRTCHRDFEDNTVTTYALSRSNLPDSFRWMARDYLGTLGGPCSPSE